MTMSTSRCVAITAAIFALWALAGPLLRLATWPPTLPTPGSSESGGDFVYDLVLLLWPTQPLAVIESSVGMTMGMAIAVLANVVLLGVLGALIGTTAKHLSLLIAAYACVAVLVAFLAFFGAGFSPSHVNVGALIVALLLYMIPFFATGRFTRETNA